MENNTKKITIVSFIILILILLKNKMNKNIFTGKSRTLSINSGYGMRGGRLHAGIDYFGKGGDKVFVKKTGKVLRVEKNCVIGNRGCGGGWGNFVEIQHTPDIKTLYAHLTDVFVNTGDNIAKNQIIGTIGNTGNSTGNHMHWEYYLNGNRINGSRFANEYLGIEET